MTKIILTPEQSSLLGSAQGSIALVLPDGRVIGWATPTPPGEPTSWDFTPEEIAEAREDLHENVQGRTTAEVLERLKLLENQ